MEKWNVSGAVEGKKMETRLLTGKMENGIEPGTV
jgi:hypothetical protein